jgi:hypothetical protein
LVGSLKSEWFKLRVFAYRPIQVQFIEQQLRMLEKHYSGQVAETGNMREFCSEVLFYTFTTDFKPPSSILHGKRAG